LAAVARRSAARWATCFGARTDQAAASFSSGRHGRPQTDNRRLTSSSLVIAREDFFIAEPQAIVSFRARRWLHIDTGIGYRFIAGAGSLDDRLDGLSGTVSVKFGGG
jgi:hypothetical protein